jgi:hypothetical protein
MCMTWIISQQFCDYKVECKLHLGVREQNRFDTTELTDRAAGQLANQGVISITRDAASSVNNPATQLGNYQQISQRRDSETSAVGQVINQAISQTTVGLQVS